ncbi:MAG: HD domain-containing protein [Patescibacteria group bacterium]
MKSISQEKLNSIVKYIFEAGILSKTPRSGFWFLGTGEQSVAEHIIRTTYIAYALAYLTPKADLNKVLLMSIFHDLGEGRTSDLNYVHQKYGRLAEKKAIRDISNKLPFGPGILKVFNEFEKRKSLESRLTKDADNLEFMASLREEEGKGNKKARAWAEIAIKRLKTEAGRKIGRLMMAEHPDSWWFKESDKWFVGRKKKDKKWR